MSRTNHVLEVSDQMGRNAVEQVFLIYQRKYNIYGDGRQLDGSHISCLSQLTGSLVKVHTLSQIFIIHNQQVVIISI